jgi:uncharacterized protein (TIGR02453 family)
MSTKTEKPTFAGFPKQMPTFFRGLARNNTREWFTPRKKVFEQHVRGPMVELLTCINEDFKTFAADYAMANPAKALYRIYRDTRFSNDKTPYKTQIGGTFHRQGLPKNSCAGMYVGVSHKCVEVAGGMYMPGPDELAAVRRAIAQDGRTLLKLVADKRLVKALGPLQGAKLVRPPKGFDDAAAAVAELLKHKQLYFYILLDGKIALTPRLRREVVERFRLLVPFVDWLNQAVLRARIGEEAEESRPKRPEPMW